jgi:cell division septal protein FtsQ
MPDDRRQTKRHSTPATPAISRSRQPGFPLRVVRAARGGQRRRGVNWQGRIGMDLRARAPQMEALPRPKPRRGDTVATKAQVVAATAPRLQTAAQPSVQKPRHRKRRTALLVLLAAQVAFACVMGWALTSPTWRVRHVEVEGTGDATLIRAIEALPLTGCNIFRCDTAGQRRLVEGLPLVAHAQIHAAYPDGLVVGVTSRQPALLWHVGGEAYVVASDGTVLGTPTSDPAFASAVLQNVQDDSAAAFGGEQPAVGQQIGAQLANMAGQLRQGLPFVLGAGWSLQYTADGFVAEDANGMRIEFGTPDDAAQASGSGAVRGVVAQIEELRSLLAVMESSGERASVSVLDLRWGGHPYYRLAGA